MIHDTFHRNLVSVKSEKASRILNDDKLFQFVFVGGVKT